MCYKCVRHIKLAKLPLGKIKYFAHYIDKYKYASIPLFNNRSDNLAIEGYLYLIRRKKTNKKLYTRKGRRNNYGY